MWVALSRLPAFFFLLLFFLLLLRLRRPPSGCALQTLNTVSGLFIPRKMINNNGAQDSLLRHAFKLQKSLFHLYRERIRETFSAWITFIQHIVLTMSWWHHVMPFPDGPRPRDEPTCCPPFNVFYFLNKIPGPFLNCRVHCRLHTLVQTYY